MIAYDFGGTLDSIPALRDHVQQRNRRNLPVACISAVSEDSHAEGRRKGIEQLTASDGTILKFDAVRIFTHPTGSDGQVDVEESGRIKARLMAEIGADTLYDDHPEIVRQVRDAGGRRAIEAFPTMSVYPGRPLAFDYGGTLRLSDGRSELRKIVRHLNLLQIPVVIISAIEGPPGKHDARLRKEIANLTTCQGHVLQFNQIRFVYYPKNPTPVDMERVGADKAAVMQEIGAAVLFDDSQHVRQGIQQFHPQLHAVGW